MCRQQGIPRSKSLYHHFQLSKSPRATLRCLSFPQYSGFDRLYTNENPTSASHQVGPDESNPSDAEACPDSNPNKHVEIRVSDESNLNESSGPHANTNLETAEACPDSNPNKHIEIRVSDESNLNESSGPHANTNLVTAEATSSNSEWNLLFTSFVIETLSAVFDLPSSPRKPQYTLIGMLLAIASVLVCIWELVHKGKKEEVSSRRRGYSPPPKNKIFCLFPEIAGLSLAITQFICLGVQYHLYRRHVTCPIILDILTAILVFCSLVLLHIKRSRLVAYDTLPNGTEATTGFK